MNRGGRFFEIRSIAVGNERILERPDNAESGQKIFWIRGRGGLLPLGCTGP